MTENLGRAVLYLETDTSKFDQGLQNSEKKASAFGSVAKTAFATGLGYLGAASVQQGFSTLVRNFGDATSAASDLNENQSKVNVVFGESAKAINDFAASAAENLGVSESAALGAAGTFGNLFTSMGLTREEAAKMSQGVLTLGSDLGSFNNLEPTEALDKLRAGLVGEAEPLRALGINLNAAAVEAKAMEMGFVDANGEVTEAGKIQARFALIMEQTTNAQGDFNRTADGTANKQRIMRAQWADLQAEIGQNLLPVQDALIAGLITLAEWVREDLSPAVSEMIGTFKRDWVPVLRAIGERILELRPIAEPIFKFFAESLGRMVDNVKEAVALIGALIDGDFSGAWEHAKNIVNNAKEQVLGYLRSLAEVGGAIVDLFGDKVIEVLGPEGLLGKLGEIGKGILDAILSPFKAAKDAILDVIGFAGGGLAGKVDDVLDNLNERLGGAPGAFAEKAQRFLLMPFEFARDHIGDIVKGLANLAIAQLNATLTAIEGFGNLFGSAVNWITDKLGLGDVVPAFDIGEIPKLARGTGHFRGGLALVGEEGPELVRLPRGSQVMPNSQTAAALKAAGFGLPIGGLPGWDDLKDALTDIPSALADTINEVLSKGVEWLVDRALDAVGFAAPVLPGVLSGVPGSLVGKIKDGLADFAGGLIDGIKRDVPLATGVWGRPLSSYVITQLFGRTPFSSVYPGGIHTGVDMGTPIGQSVMSVDGGRVTAAGLAGGYGNAVMVTHNGLASLYGHLNRIAVAVGQLVTKGQTLGDSGNTGFSTGPHLHLEAREHGVPIDPMRLVALANGGIVTRPTLALIGERGPEVVAPLDRLGGGNVYQTNYVYSPEDARLGTLRAFRQLALQAGG